MKLKIAIICLIIIGLAVLFYRHTFIWLYNEWTAGGVLNRDNPYGHGFLIPLISAFILWSRRAHFSDFHPRTIGILPLALGAIIYLIGLYTVDSRALVALSLPIVLAGATILIWGWPTTRAAAFPLFFLLFMIPPPFIQDLTYHLQQISYDSSRWFADLAGVQTFSNPEEGDMVILVGSMTAPSAKLQIAPACSGINTLVALLALGALYAFILNGPFWKRAILFALAFPVAILGNSLRIATIIMRGDNRGAESAMTLHDWSDPLFFALALLILILLGIALGLFFTPRKSIAPKRHPLVGGWLIILIVVYIVAALFSIAGSALDAQGLKEAPAWAVGLLSAAAMISVGCCLALWQWKRWGAYGMAAAAVVGFGVTLGFGGSILASLGWLMAVAILGASLFWGKDQRAWNHLT